MLVVYGISLKRLSEKSTNEDDSFYPPPSTRALFLRSERVLRSPISYCSGGVCLSSPSSVRTLVLLCILILSLTTNTPHDHGPCSMSNSECRSSGQSLFRFREEVTGSSVFSNLKVHLTFFKICLDASRLDHDP
jgi:hypothetical protein